MLTKKTGIILLLGVMAFIIVIGLLLNPIPQPQTYHKFADQRYWLGIPNAWNVLSNIPFALAGIWGLFLLSSGKIHFKDNRERWPWIGFSIGLILTAIGSGYYHLAPDNSRLVWDRLTMTIVFMSFLAALISERINILLGLLSWPILLCIGFYSVLQWQESELHGIGDLRFYLGMLGFTFLMTLVMLLIHSPYDRNWDLAVVAILYVLARLFELYDRQIYTFNGGIISGHTLKHLVAAMAGIWLIHMIWKRKIVKS